MDSFLFTPSSVCALCNHIIHLDPNSPTGATATIPCELWSESILHGFCLKARNFGTCKVFIYVKRGTDADFKLASFPVTLTNADGTPVIGENGNPVTAFPFEPFAIFDAHTEINELPLLSNEFFTAIGVLCIRSSPAVCPICDVEFELTLSCGETLLYKIAAPLLANPSVMTALTIHGTVQCRVDTDTINTRNLRAQLVSCACCKTCPSRVLATVPIIPSSTMTNQGTYEFKNVQVECFRVIIICANTGTTSTSTVTVLNAPNNSANNTMANVLGASDCQLVNATTTIMVDPIAINCNTCEDRIVTVTGTAVCSNLGGNVSNVTVQFIRCEKKGDVKCGTAGNMACGSPLMVTPTFTAPLGTDGKFSAMVPEDCYFIRFVCTSSPTTVLTTSPVLSCTFFCKATTNIGTITIPCTCPSPTVTLSGSVACLPVTTSLPSGLIARLITCVPPATGTNCGTITSASVIVSTVAVDDTTGVFDFGSVTVGCYAVRILCTSCSEDTPITDIGGIACTSLTTNTVIAPISINCSVCNTVEISGTITCTTGSVSGVQLQVSNFTPGCTTLTSITIITPNATTGAYSLCVTSGIGVSFQIVCTSTGAILFPSTACTTITSPTVRNFTIANCTC